MLKSCIWRLSGCCNTPKAVSLLRQAIVLSPANATYYNAFVMLCLDHDSFQVGIDMINAGLMRIPNDSTLYISRWPALCATCGLRQGRSRFQHRGAPGPGTELERLCKGHGGAAEESEPVRQGSSERALLEVRSQLKAHPDSALLHYLLASLLVNQESGTDKKGGTGGGAKSALLAVKFKAGLLQEAQGTFLQVFT